MKWFWRWIRSNIHAASESDAVKSNRLVGNDEMMSSGIRFNLYRANTGMVVEVHPQRYYDIKPGDIGLYIIRDEDDLGQQLSQIITIEKLRN